MPTETSARALRGMADAIKGEFPNDRHAQYLRDAADRLERLESGVHRALDWLRMVTEPDDRVIAAEDVLTKALRQPDAAPAEKVT